MLAGLGLLLLIVGIVLIVLGKKQSNKTLLYIGIIILVVGAILGAKDFAAGFMDGFNAAGAK